MQINFINTIATIFLLCFLMRIIFLFFHALYTLFLIFFKYILKKKNFHAAFIYMDGDTFLSFIFK